MDTQLIVLLGMIALVLVSFLAGIWAYVKAARSHRISAKFSRGMLPRLRSGERREKQRAREYRQKRKRGQRDFLDDPQDAAEKADQLVHEIMKKRGYPVTKIW